MQSCAAALEATAKEKRWGSRKRTLQQVQTKLASSTTHDNTRTWTLNSNLHYSMLATNPSTPGPVARPRSNTLPRLLPPMFPPSRNLCHIPQRIPNLPIAIQSSPGHIQNALQSSLIPISHHLHLLHTSLPNRPIKHPRVPTGAQQIRNLICMHSIQTSFLHATQPRRAQTHVHELCPAHERAHAIVGESARGEKRAKGGIVLV